MLNPPNEVITDTFAIVSYSYDDLLIDAKYDIDSFVITSKQDVGKLTHLGFSANPSNGYSVADYTISFRPSRSYPAYSEILIIFPIAEFPSLSFSGCSLSGGLTSLDSCTAYGTNGIILTTDSFYLYN